MHSPWRGISSGSCPAVAFRKRLNRKWFVTDSIRNDLSVTNLFRKPFRESSIWFTLACSPLVLVQHRLWSHKFLGAYHADSQAPVLLDRARRPAGDGGVVAGRPAGGSAEGPEAPRGRCRASRGRSSACSTGRRSTRSICSATTGPEGPPLRSNGSAASPTLHAVKLTNPTDYAEVFRVVDAELASVVNVPRQDALDLCMHLSPGTPTMTAIWLLLGKSKYHPATFFQTHDGKAWVTEVPFDLVVDFVPQVLRDADARLQALASQSPQEVEGFEAIAGDSRSHPGRRRACPAGGPAGRLGPAPRRERHRQGDVRQGDPRRQPPPGQAVRRHQLRRHLQGVAGVRTLRPQEGGVHRGGGGPGRGVQGGRRRARCSWTRSASATRRCRPSCCGSCSPPTTTPCHRVFYRVGESKPIDQRRPHHRRHEPGPARRRRRAPSSGTTSTTGWRSSRSSCRRCGSGGRTSRSIVGSLLERINRNFERQEPGYRHKPISGSAMEFVKKYPWPGNVRQLYNTLMQAAVMTDERVDRAAGRRRCHRRGARQADDGPAGTAAGRRVFARRAPGRDPASLPASGDGGGRGRQEAGRRTARLPELPDARRPTGAAGGRGCRIRDEERILARRVP